MTLRSSLRSWFGFAQKEKQETKEETKPKARGPYFYGQSIPSNANSRRQDSDTGYTPHTDFSYASSGHDRPSHAAPVRTNSCNGGPTFDFGGGSDGGSCGGDGGGGD